MEKNRKEINKSDDLIKRSDLLEHIREFTSISNGYFENPELLERVIREMPNTEAKADEDKEWFDGYEKGKIDGLNDAWEFIKNLWSIVSDGVKMELFGTIFVTDILKNYTPQEALAKLKAYEDRKNRVQVGDVIKTPVGNAVVTYVREEEYIAITSSGAHVRLEGLVAKTGKHIDIKSILEQIKSKEGANDEG